ncbi:snoRNA-binding rRNA-processing protein [Saitoella coloradoensis]
MPKTAKVTRPRHDPLHLELQEDNAEATGAVWAGARTQRKKFADREARPEKEEEYVDPKLSRKILQLAQEQQDELDTENGVVKAAPAPRKDTLNQPRLEMVDDEEGEEDEEEYEDFGDDVVEEIEVDEGDEELFKKFLPSGLGERQSLADMIMQRIKEKEAGVPSAAPEVDQQLSLPPKVVEVYTKVGQLLHRYKSGKLPKAFKIIPGLRNWEEILWITRPDEWSPNACYEATRVFVSNLKAIQTQKFMSNILLQRVRDDIYENKKLNYHLYMSLKKGLYKPAAWFKGFLFPLCQSGSCTLKEAAIVASVLVKVSVPALHSSAALLRLAEMDYTGPSSLFIRVLLDKKYALPYKVVDALVFHFLRLPGQHEDLPVIFWQSFLIFAQRYKNDVTPEQKDALLDIIKSKGHPQIGPEIRRELQGSVSRGEMLPEPDMDMMV